MVVKKPHSSSTDPDSQRSKENDEPDLNVQNMGLWTLDALGRKPSRSGQLIPLGALQLGWVCSIPKCSIMFCVYVAVCLFLF
jgi:hypothetical protein